MSIQLTDEQWTDVQKSNDLPIRVNDPSQSAAFVLLKAEVYERFKALFEDVPITDQERRFKLEQFGRRAGWDDPEMDIYDDLDPRRQICASAVETSCWWTIRSVTGRGARSGRHWSFNATP